MKRMMSMSVGVLLVFVMYAAMARGATAADDANLFGLGGQYPIVLLAVPGTDKDFQHAKDLGANYVHLYGLSFSVSPENMQRMRHYLDLAQKYGLKVMFDLDGSTRMTKKDGMQEMRQIVDAFKDHPALGCWYLADEPEGHGVTPAVAHEYYQMLKKQSPNVPVCLLTMTGPEWRHYLDSLDIYSADIYPVASKRFPCQSLEEVVDFNRQAIATDKPVLPCLQAFNYVFIDAESYIDAGTFHDAAKQKFLRELRYPTEEELRYWNFATLVQGARGVIYYSYLRGIQSSLAADGGKYAAEAGKDWEKQTQADPHWIDGPFKTATHELQAFTDLVEPAWKHQIIPPGDTQDVMEGVWKHGNKTGNKTYVVIVNNWPLTRDIRLTEDMYAPFKEGRAIPWGFSRHTTPYVGSGGLIKMRNVRPWEVLVWEVDGGK